MYANPTQRAQKFLISYRKEKYFSRQVSGLVWDGDKIREAVILRIYQTDARAYACVWTYCTGYNSGSGCAGGYGYHRASAAAANAIYNAGFDLSEDIAGRGDSAIREAVKAITEFQFPGCPVFVHEANA